VLLEDGRWLSHYVLPDEKKRVFAYRFSSTASCAAAAASSTNKCVVLGPLGVGADLRNLLQQSSSLVTNSGLSVSITLTGRAPDVNESTPEQLSELATLLRGMQDKDTRADARLALARKQVHAMRRALQEAKVQDEAVQLLTWYAEEKLEKEQKSKEQNSRETCAEGGEKAAAGTQSKRKKLTCFTGTKVQMLACCCGGDGEAAKRSSVSRSRLQYTNIYEYTNIYGYTII